MAGIYIHIPYCKKACIYCDFHFSTTLKNKNELLSSLAKELRLRKDYLEGEVIETIYFGGGTPSILSAGEIEALLHEINQLHLVKGNVEITLEANPDDLNPKYLEQLKRSGINRLSIGLQSFEEDELKWMNRAHTAMESEASVKAAQDAGFGNISIDLIYGSKFQTPEIWEHNLEKAFALNVQHISAYNLTVEEKTILGNLVHKGKEKEVSELSSSAYFEQLIKEASKNDFIHYEISNFCREGFYSRHNSSYWRGKKYMGIGPSAHSYNSNSRQWNIKNNALYIRSLNEDKLNFELEQLTVEQHYNEYLLTTLRTIWGAELAFITSGFGIGYAEHCMAEAQKYIDSGHLVYRENKLILSDKGKLLADRIASDLFI
ncbi:MAG: radical SAM family heme chaperone HemW [Bacteroidia bacterium]